MAGHGEDPPTGTTSDVYALFDRAVYRQNGTRQEFAGILFNGSVTAYNKVVAQGLN